MLNFKCIPLFISPNNQETKRTKKHTLTSFPPPVKSNIQRLKLSDYISQPLKEGNYQQVPYNPVNLETNNLPHIPIQNDGINCLRDLLKLLNFKSTDELIEEISHLRNSKERTESMLDLKTQMEEDNHNLKLKIREYEHIISVSNTILSNEERTYSKPTTKRTQTDNNESHLKVLQTKEKELQQLEKKLVSMSQEFKEREEYITRCEEELIRQSNSIIEQSTILDQKWDDLNYLSDKNYHNSI